MENINSNWIVISVGGSLIAPDKVDALYVAEFVRVIKENIVAGGGKIAREYRDALIAADIEEQALLDWMGIYATRYNAELLRLAFQDMAESAIFLDPTNIFQTGKPIIVGGGWKPGHSSDGSAVALATTLGAKKLINLSNIDYVYDADPKKNPDAKKIEKISWADFRNIIPKEWDPGLNSPFDPVASAMAEKAGIEVAILNGAHLEELSNYLEGKSFKGTIIS